MFLWLSLFLVASPVSVEVEILNGDVMAARDVAQQKAFEKAVEQTFTPATPVDVRAQKLKTPARYIKSYRLIDEKRLGEKLAMTYEIELQEMTEAPAIAAAPLPDAAIPLPPRELRFEVVFVERFPAADLVDQLTSQMKIQVNSFRLTRSAIILKVWTERPVLQVQQEMQALVGARGTVNYVSEEIGVPQPLAAPTPSLAPIIVPETPVEPPATQVIPSEMVPPAASAPVVPPPPSVAAPALPPSPSVADPSTPALSTPVVEAPTAAPEIQPAPEISVTPPAAPPSPVEPEAPKKKDWKPVRPKPWTPPIFQQQNRP